MLFIRRLPSAFLWMWVTGPASVGDEGDRGESSALVAVGNGDNSEGEKIVSSTGDVDEVEEMEDEAERIDVLGPALVVLRLNGWGWGWKGLEL